MSQLGKKLLGDISSATHPRPKVKAAPIRRKAPPLGSLQGTKVTQSSPAAGAFERRLRGLPPAQQTQQHNRKLLTPKQRDAQQIRHQVVHASLVKAGIKAPTHAQVLAVSRHPAVQKDLHKAISDYQARNERVAKASLALGSATQAATSKVQFPAPKGRQAVGKVGALGITLPDAVVRAAHAVGGSAVNVAKAVYHDPLGQTGKAATFLGEGALAAGGAVAGAGVAIARDTGNEILHPADSNQLGKYSWRYAKGLVNAEGKHISDTYGGLYRNEPGAAKKQLKQLEKGGVGSVVGDLAVVKGALGGVGKAVDKAGYKDLTPQTRALKAKPRTATRNAHGDLVTPAQPTTIGSALRGQAADKLRSKLPDKMLQPTVRGIKRPGENATIAAHVPLVNKAKVAVAGHRTVAEAHGRARTDEALRNAEAMRLGHIKGLSSAERTVLPHAVELGIRSTTPDIHALLLQRLHHIANHHDPLVNELMQIHERATARGKMTKAETKRAEALTHKLHVNKADSEITDLNALLSKSNAELKASYFTPKTDAAAVAERSLNASEGALNPGMTDEQVAQRAIQNQGALLGEERHRGETKKQYADRLKSLERKALKESAAAEQDVHHFTGRAEILSRNVDGTVAAENAATRYGNLRARKDHPAPSGGAYGIDQATARYEAAQARLQAIRAARGEPAKAQGELARHYGHTPETAAAYAERVTAKAAEHGLDRGGYIPSLRETQSATTPRAEKGGTSKAYRPSKDRSNYALGRRQLSIEKLISGHLANNRTAAEWNRDIHLFAPHEKGGQTITQLTGADGRVYKFDPTGLTKKQIERKLKDAGYGGENSPFEAVPLGAVKDARAVTGMSHGVPETSALERLRAATESGAKSDAGAYVLWRKGAADEHFAQLAPVSGAVRGFEKFTRFQTAPILGLSPTWAAFQVPANLATALIASPGSIVRYRGNQRLLKSLTPEERHVFNVWTGHGASGDYLSGPSLSQLQNEQILSGQIADRVAPSLRAAAAKANPMKALFTFDRWEVGKFREALMADHVRKIASMTHDLSKISADLSHASLEDRFAAVVNNKALLDRAAGKLNEAMGDFVTMTSAERKFLRSSLMFYGYLRYSTRLLFYTLPVRHPAMAGVLSNLGQLHKDEVTGIIGNGLPSAMGIVPLGNGKFTDLTRANPLGNSIVQELTGNNPASIVGALPPVATASLEALFGKSAYKGTALTERGAGGYVQPLSSVSGRVRYLIGQMLRLPSPVGVIEKGQAVAHLRKGEVQTSDSIPFLSPRYGMYKDPKTILSIEKSAGTKPKPLQQLGGYLAPGFPRSLDDVLNISQRNLKKSGDKSAADALKRAERAVYDGKPGARIALLRLKQQQGLSNLKDKRKELRNTSPEDRLKLLKITRQQKLGIK